MLGGESIYAAMELLRGWFNGYHAASASNNPPASIAGTATDVGFVRSNVGAQRSPIDRRDPVARAQSSLRRRASFYHVIN